MIPGDENHLIGIVGPCGAGKSTLAGGLVNVGMKARSIAQEHSFVPQMWLMLTNPAILIFLQASYPVCASRKNFSWTLSEWEEQQRRLAHARTNAHLFIDTDTLSIPEVIERTLNFLHFR